MQCAVSWLLIVSGERSEGWRPERVLGWGHMGEVGGAVRGRKQVLIEFGRSCGPNRPLIALSSEEVPRVITVID